ncbi:uncharacterized protein METZ01_LOCUS290568 [marine metagenome]|uniref:Uncharacterized protein n=1 Tax=marine metagenome TaxID=408172 RepID=A0A382LLK8_9ZZZZ
MQLIALSLCVNAQVVRLGYTTLKVVTQFGENLIGKSNCQSFVSDNRHHRFVRRDEKGAEETTPSKTTFTAIHPIILLFYQRYNESPPSPPLAFKHWYMQLKTEETTLRWRRLSHLQEVLTKSCFEIVSSVSSAVK